MGEVDVPLGEELTSRLVHSNGHELLGIGGESASWGMIFDSVVFPSFGPLIMSRASRCSNHTA
eukprot:2507235-Amphidinium_carterae.1